METDVFAQIVKFVKRERPPSFFAYIGISKQKYELERGTRLEQDLGLYGDDAEDFLEAFSKEFNVDMSECDLSDYFSSEGFRPLARLSDKIRGRNPKDLTLGQLEEAVKIEKLVT